MRFIKYWGERMIYVKNTPHNTGVTIYGDYMDFDALYNALHTLTGDEGEFNSYAGARLRVLGVCFDIRHALMGDRGIEFVDNGMDQDKMKRLSTISSGKNIYLSINVLWPEMLFVTMALNDFVRLYARKQSKNSYNMMMDWRVIWDSEIAQVKMLQAAVAKCIKEMISDSSFSRTMKLMTKEYEWFNGYAEQYVDLLNCSFIKMDSEKRLKNITIMAKRLAEFGQEYQEVKSEIIEAAAKNNCSINDIRLNAEYPEDIEW